MPNMQTGNSRITINGEPSHCQSGLLLCCFQPSMIELCSWQLSLRQSAAGSRHATVHAGMTPGHLGSNLPQANGPYGASGQMGMQQHGAAPMRVSYSADFSMQGQCLCLELQLLGYQ